VIRRDLCRVFLLFAGLHFSPVARFNVPGVQIYRPGLSAVYGRLFAFWRHAKNIPFITVLPFISIMVFPFISNSRFTKFYHDNFCPKIPQKMSTFFRESTRDAMGFLESREKVVKKAPRKS
jgi:hypothetical protein